jgi:hypothetical protein
LQILCKIIVELIRAVKEEERIVNYRKVTSSNNSVNNKSNNNKTY